MGYYLSKYIGKYRLKAEIDKDTNDFCRDDKGNLCNYTDIWIDCQKGNRIYHYGHNILHAYIPSIIRGNKIIHEESLKDIIFDIHVTDAEVEFKFKDKDLDILEKYLLPRTSGAGISPFSTKNLNRKKFGYSAQQLEDYKKITDKIPKEDKLVLSKLLSQFIANKLPKKIANISKDDMKKSGYFGKDWIYYKGYEKQYLNFLEQKIGEMYE